MDNFRICMPSTSYPRHQGDPAGNFIHALAMSIAQRPEVDSVQVVAPGGPNLTETETVCPGISVDRFTYFLPRRAQTLAYGNGILPNIREHPGRLLLVPFFVSAFSRKIRSAARITSLIHAHWSISGLCALLARPPHVPLVVTFHGSDFSGAGHRLVDSMSYLVARRADRIVCVSEQLRERALERGLPVERIRTIRNGIDLDRFHPRRDTACLSKTAVRNSSPVLTLIGRLSSVKGPDRALDLFGHCLDEFPQAGLVFVGDGPMRRELEERVLGSELLAGKVWFAGEQPTEAIPSFLAAADALIVSSHFEGLPTCVLEAMAAGCPVVSVPVGGVGEVITDEQTGFLAPENSEAALRAALTRCFMSAEHRQRVARNARTLVERDYAWTRCAAQHISLYRELLCGKGTMHGSHRST